MNFLRELIEAYKKGREERRVAKREWEERMGLREYEERERRAEQQRKEEKAGIRYCILASGIHRKYRGLHRDEDPNRGWCIGDWLMGEYEDYYVVNNWVKVYRGETALDVAIRLGYEKDAK